MKTRVYIPGLDDLTTLEERKMSQQGFQIGRLVITRTAEQEAQRVFGVDRWAAAIGSLLVRHVTGDWGDINKQGKQANDDATKTGGRIMSVYQVTPDSEFWIITEADRSATTILLPQDY
jgi:hypothetical protein